MFDRLQALKRETIGLLDRSPSWSLIFKNRYIIKGSLQKLFGIFFPTKRKVRHFYLRRWKHLFFSSNRVTICNLQIIINLNRLKIWFKRANRARKILNIVCGWYQHFMRGDPYKLGQMPLDHQKVSKVNHYFEGF